MREYGRRHAATAATATSFLVFGHGISILLPHPRCNRTQCRMSTCGCGTESRESLLYRRSSLGMCSTAWHCRRVYIVQRIERGALGRSRMSATVRRPRLNETSTLCLVVHQVLDHGVSDTGMASGWGPMNAPSDTVNRHIRAVRNNDPVNVKQVVRHIAATRLGVCSLLVRLRTVTESTLLAIEIVQTWYHYVNTT